MSPEKDLCCDRQTAWDLLCSYAESDSLRKHALAVECAMRACARHFGEDEELWGVVGLIHDFDYEKYPDAATHPYAGERILEKLGYPESVRRAIMSHASYTGVPRDTLMARALFSVDELSGFVTACALVKPSRSIFEVEAKSVIKKMKDKAFARAVSRDDIRQGALELGVELEEHIGLVINAMKEAAGQLGLVGTAEGRQE